MPRFISTIVILALAVAACSSSTNAEPVASIDSTTTTVAADAAATTADPLLAFSACMRDNGVEDFQDPIVDADGKVEFPDKADEAKADDFAAAFESCAYLLEGTAFGATAKGDDVEGLDQLYDFAVCMREQGFDIADPDPETGSLGEVDKDDPAFEAAWEQCGATFEGDTKDS